MPPSLSLGGFLLHTTWVFTVDTRSGHNHWFLGLRSGQNHLGSVMAEATDCGVIKTTGLDCVVVQTTSFTHVASTGFARGAGVVFTRRAVVGFTRGVGVGFTRGS